MPNNSAAQNRKKSPDFGLLQDLVDYLFQDPRTETVRRLDVVVLAEACDLPKDLIEIIELLPPGPAYTRQHLCDQLNSAIGGHAWGQVYGTVE
ncbi:MAG: hypothetical protein ACOYCA_05225 [Eggerthellaceae bacterium]|jgi:hypothetical protein